MEFNYLFLIICVITISADSEAFFINKNETTGTSVKSLNLVKRETGRECVKGAVVLQPYALYLIGCTMVIMLIVIIFLAVVLCLIIKKRKVFGITINDNKQYVRQESTGIATLYNSNYEEHNKYDGSTLTVNSGIIEINRVSDPETPTRIEDSRITFTKRPMKSMVPIIHKGQMDEICKEVLRKVQKSDSASFRDLNELLQGKGEDKFETKCKPVNESEKEDKNNVEEEAKHEISQESKQESKYEPKQETKDEPKLETKNEPIAHEEKTGTLNETKNEVKHEQNKSNDVKIKVKDADGDISTDDSETETEYDIVPSPIRYSGAESDDFDIDSIPVYDLPPRRSFEGPSRNMIQFDQDSQYLLPLSAKQSDSCYINAKRNSYHTT